jgi:hypothetical protein
METNKMLNQSICKTPQKQLGEFEPAIRDMTAQERKELREWVKSGNDIFENPWCISWENGWPMDYIHALRFHNGMAEEMARFRWATQECSQNGDTPF